MKLDRLDTLVKELNVLRANISAINREIVQLRRARPHAERLRDLGFAVKDIIARSNRLVARLRGVKGPARESLGRVVGRIKGKAQELQRRYGTLIGMKL